MVDKDDYGDTFEIRCKLCGSDDVMVLVAGYDGEIAIECRECDNAKEMK